MAKYIMLGNWTEQGVRNVKDTVKRARATREQFAGLGVNAREFFWTMGQYDVVLTFDAPDDETMMRATLAVAAAGNLRTTTLRGTGRAGNGARTREHSLKIAIKRVGLIGVGLMGTGSARTSWLAATSSRSWRVATACRSMI